MQRYQFNNVSFLKSGSILAFFVGNLLGLIYLQCIPKKSSGIKWFSICGGLISLTLVLVIKNNRTESLTGIIAIVFFFLLCLRFGFLFYSRVIRASHVAGIQQRIAWVELGYYLGMILGLDLLQE